jgi:hypothetical protein
VLNVRLGIGRQSLDLDSNLAAPFVQRYPDREAQRVFLEEEMTRAVRRHFERLEPVQYELTALKVRIYPPKSHLMGWDAFKVRINMNDLGKRVSGLPALEIDVAAPEELLDTSITTIEVGAHRVHAYAEAPIPKDISFEEAEATIVAIVSFLEAQGIVPFVFPLPEGTAG